MRSRSPMQSGIPNQLAEPLRDTAMARAGALAVLREAVGAIGTLGGRASGRTARARVGTAHVIPRRVHVRAVGARRRCGGRWRLGHGRRRHVDGGRWDIGRRGRYVDRGRRHRHLGCRHRYCGCSGGVGLRTARATRRNRQADRSHGNQYRCSSSEHPRPLCHAVWTVRPGRRPGLSARRPRPPLTPSGDSTVHQALRVVSRPQPAVGRKTWP
jgi:hypothetical protein